MHFAVGMAAAVWMADGGHVALGILAASLVVIESLVAFVDGLMS